jgi:hypothetical protein
VEHGGLRVDGNAGRRPHKLLWRLPSCRPEGRVQTSRKGGASGEGDMGAVQAMDRKSGDPVAGGFYTVREAARLLTIGQPARISSWLDGYKRTAVGPIIYRQYKPIDRVQELGFWDLLEVRFVDHFRRQGVSLQALRKAANNARELWNTEHPFAMDGAQFLTDRKEVFLAAAKETKDQFLLNLVTKQYEIYVVLEEFLARGVSFDPTTGLARQWRPKPKELPAIALDPLIAYGRPVVMPEAVPTESIYKLWKAEGGSFKAAADWFAVTEEAAHQAIDFELGLPD